MKILVKRVGIHLLATPEQESSSAAGYDLRSSVDMIIRPGNREIVPTGFAWKIPFNFVGQIWPRSGFAVKYGIDVLAGVIDSDYRGEVGVVLINHGHEDFIFVKGDRIAQMIVVPCIHEHVISVNQLSVTERNEGGFGHTGT